MRKTSDLVNEMLMEAKKTFLVAIAVGFPTETKFVFSSAKSPIKDLNTLVQRGGSPIGLLRFEKEKAEMLDIMNGGNADPKKLTEASTKYSEITNQLEELEMRWLELSELF